MPDLRGRRRAQRLGRTLAAWVFVLLALPARALQEPAPPAPRPSGEPHGERAELHEQMIELIRQVERRMKELEVTLFDASASDRSPDRVETGVSVLVEQARAEGRRVCEDINKILELAKRHAHPSAGGS